MSESWASATRMAFNTSKCKVMVLNGPCTDVNLKLYNDTFQIADTYKYLGVTITSKYITNLFKAHFTLLLQKAKVRASTLRRYSFREDGLRLASAI